MTNKQNRNHQPHTPYRQAIRILATVSIAIAITGCFAIGLIGGSKSKQSVAGTDSISAYQEHLAQNPNDPDTEKHKKRLAELELVELRKNLQPEFKDSALFSDNANGKAMGQFSPHVDFIFDSHTDDWFGLQTTAIKPDYSKESMDFFVENGEVSEVKFGKDDRVGSIFSNKNSQKKRNSKFFTIHKLSGIPLIQTSSFEMNIKQISGFHGGLRFCFFSSTPDNCDNGYEFYYDSAGFKEYSLKQKSNGQETELCGYKMSTANFQHSDNITLNDTRTGRKDPEISISAHNGFIEVVFNGVNICSEEDHTHTGGYFLIGNTSAVAEFSIDMNAGSEPFYVQASDLVNIQTGAETLSPLEGSFYDEHAKFASDYNAYVQAVNTNSAPSADFSNAYFAQLLGKGEADEKYEAVRAKNNVDAYLAYLEEYPVNSHKKEIHEVIYELTKKKNTVEAYQKYLTQYPETILRLEVQKRIGDVEWNGTVKKGTKSEFKAYLSKYPNGYHKSKAELLLKSLDYYSENKEEVDRKNSIIKAAQKAVNKSPITGKWNVMVIDYVDGNLYYNLNDGPVYKRGDRHSMLDMAQVQIKAYNETCRLMTRRVGGIEKCLMAWNADVAKPGNSLPASFAIIKAIKQFYISQLENGVEVYTERLLGLAEKLVELNDRSYEREDSPALFAAHIYSLLDLNELAINALYQYAFNAKGAGSVERYFVKGYYQSLKGNKDYEWIVDTFGGRMSDEDKDLYKRRLKAIGR